MMMFWDVNVDGPFWFLACMLYELFFYLLSLLFKLATYLLIDVFCGSLLWSMTAIFIPMATEIAIALLMVVPSLLMTVSPTMLAWAILSILGSAASSVSRSARRMFISVSANAVRSLAKLLCGWVSCASDQMLLMLGARVAEDRAEDLITIAEDPEEQLAPSVTMGSRSQLQTNLPGRLQHLLRERDDSRLLPQDQRRLHELECLIEDLTTEYGSILGSAPCRSIPPRRFASTFDQVSMDRLPCRHDDEDVNTEQHNQSQLMDAPTSCPAVCHAAKPVLTFPASDETESPPQMEDEVVEETTHEPASSLEPTEDWASVSFSHASDLHTPEEMIDDSQIPQEPQPDIGSVASPAPEIPDGEEPEEVVEDADLEAQEEAQGPGHFDPPVMTDIGADGVVAGVNRRLERSPERDGRMAKRQRHVAPASVEEPVSDEDSTVDAMLDVETTDPAIATDRAQELEVPMDLDEVMDVPDADQMDWTQDGDQDQEEETLAELVAKLQRCTLGDGEESDVAMTGVPETVPEVVQDGHDDTGRQASEMNLDEPIQAPDEEMSDYDFDSGFLEALVEEGLQWDTSAPGTEVASLEYPHFGDIVPQRVATASAAGQEPVPETDNNDDEFYRDMDEAWAIFEASPGPASSAAAAARNEVSTAIRSDTRPEETEPAFSYPSPPPPHHSDSYHPSPVSSVSNGSVGAIAGEPFSGPLPGMSDAEEGREEEEREPELPEPATDKKGKGKERATFEVPVDFQQGAWFRHLPLDPRVASVYEPTGGDGPSRLHYPPDFGNEDKLPTTPGGSAKPGPTPAPASIEEASSVTPSTPATLPASQVIGSSAAGGGQSKEVPDKPQRKGKASKAKKPSLFHQKKGGPPSTPYGTRAPGSAERERQFKSSQTLEGIDTMALDEKDGEVSKPVARELAIAPISFVKTRPPQE
ncbi:hypothetical protein CP533_1339 [Ophiocordyceps camponoti-saundersi (nom. inval.)]|nr:hypothetical protein CP533_1339 [Ophiocordyceps camponoti-saundersi (nom. inval.)]